MGRAIISRKDTRYNNLGQVDIPDIVPEFKMATSMKKAADRPAPNTWYYPLGSATAVAAEDGYLVCCAQYCLYWQDNTSGAVSRSTYDATGWIKVRVNGEEYIKYSKWGSDGSKKLFDYGSGLPIPNRPGGDPYHDIYTERNPSIIFMVVKVPKGATCACIFEHTGTLINYYNLSFSCSAL